MLAYNHYISSESIWCTRRDEEMEVEELSENLDEKQTLLLPKKTTNVPVRRYSNNGGPNFENSDSKSTYKQDNEYSRLQEDDEEEDILDSESEKESSLDEKTLLLASTYITDALHGRNGHFIHELNQLKIYYWYNHGGIRLGLFLVIILNLSLVLFEKPAVHGLGLPFWVTMLVELFCIFVYCLRLIHAWHFMETWRYRRDPKIIIVIICLVLTLLDMGATIVMYQLNIKSFNIRWTRILRPAFLVNFSESRELRRTVRNIRRTLPEITSVLLLFLLVIALYALLGFKLFENRKIVDYSTHQPYFANYADIYFDLYVLTTTANNPDIMIPAYNGRNWTVLYFVVFTIICMYIFVSIFLAVVYNNYRTHLKNEVKMSLYRKWSKMLCAFKYLQISHQSQWVVRFSRFKQVVQHLQANTSLVQIKLYWKILDKKNKGFIEFSDFVHLPYLLQMRMDGADKRGHFFKRFFPIIYESRVSKMIITCVKHKLFVYFFDLVIIANAIYIGLRKDSGDIAFLVVFNVEIVLKLYTYGPAEFVRRFWNIFDAIVIEAATVICILTEIFSTLRESEVILDFLLILRVLRLFKIFGNKERFRVIINTIMQIGPAIFTYGGIMFVLYYVYAIVGMEIFQGRVNDYGVKNFSSLTEMQRLCGNKRLNGSEFSRLYYCEKNFNNIVKSYVILFDLTVVNQWHVITDGFVRVTHKAARLYFFSFHMLCVIVVMNIFVAFILEAFMLQYSLSKGNFEAALEKKILEKGRASSTILQSSGTEGQIGSMQRLDLNFAINEYMSETGITFKLRKTRTKNAELLLQQMFEDELDEKDLGPELMDDDEELNEVVENNELLPLPRKLTLQTIDLV